VDFEHVVVGAGLALIGGAAGVCAALPSANRPTDWSFAWRSAHHREHNRRLRLFAIYQIAASFLLLAGASMLVKNVAGFAVRADRI